MDADTRNPKTRASGLEIRSDDPSRNFCQTVGYPPAPRFDVRIGFAYNKPAITDSPPPRLDGGRSKVAALFAFGCPSRPKCSGRGFDGQEEWDTPAEAGRGRFRDTDRDGSPTTPADDPQFPIVGIGASAGGLDAFRKLLGGMPADSGMAFVLVPHLDPTHESLMADLLARSTTMPVVEAGEDMPVEVGRVYVLPPNKYMTIGGGRLHLTGPVERRGLPTSIDLFLRSLADDRGEQAIGVILSGTGSHGTLGVKAIKAGGGMAMVQDPRTAEYDGMPRSAITTGLADYILPPEQMPQALIRYVEHFSAAGDRAAEAADEADMAQILDLFRNCGQARLPLLPEEDAPPQSEKAHGPPPHRPDPRIPRLPARPPRGGHPARQGLPDQRDELLPRPGGVPDPGRTGDPPTRPAPRGPDDTLRVWVPGCATGEEAYSIAMLLIEQLESARTRPAASRSSPRTWPRTRWRSPAGGVTPRTSRPTSPPIGSRDSSSPTGGHSYQVNKQLREAITFAAQNVLGDPPFSKLDLISPAATC